MKTLRGGDPKPVGDLLEKYRKTLRAPEGSVITAFQQALKDELGMKLEKKFITYRVSSRTLIVSVAGAQKSEIILHKQELLHHCRESLGEKNVPKQII